jgi:hypothetical protein
MQLEHNDQSNNLAADPCIRILGIRWTGDISPYLPMTQVGRGDWKNLKLYIELDTSLLWPSVNAISIQTTYYIFKYRKI